MTVIETVGRAATVVWAGADSTGAASVGIVNTGTDCGGAASVAVGAVGSATVGRAIEPRVAVGAGSVRVPSPEAAPQPATTPPAKRTRPTATSAVDRRRVESRDPLRLRPVGIET